MSDHEESVVVWKQSPAVQTALASILVALLGILLVASAPSGSRPAIATVGLVLTEALVLYVGYGALTRVVSPAARELLGSH
uniref:DUF7512 family protein n=1 Tax=Natronococcus wangiae TaxID=3068275 RepID=UPI00273EBCEF|nr:hypothetical protein [Natronococcus sp. AD5]